MTVSQFAERWLERNGMRHTESEYDAAIGQDALALMETLHSQGRTRTERLLLMSIVTTCYAAYDDQDSELWQEYRDEQRRQAS